MRQSRRPLRIASRRSRLAQVQAQMVGHLLAECHVDLAVHYVWIESEGDQQADASLANRGGKGLFTGALEEALLKKRADVAVHSLKDVPVAGTRGLTIAAVPHREVVHDCLIARGPASLDQLPAGSLLGTSSPRRAAQVKRRRDDLRIEPIRGNVDTRIKKVLELRRYDATLLAAAGLRRLELHEHAKRPVATDVLLPAAGQGALAIQCRSNDHATRMRCMPLNHASTAEAVYAERRIVQALGGDCHSSIAVLAQADQIEGLPSVRIRVQVLRPDGSDSVDVDQRGPAQQTSLLVKRVLKELTERGATKLL